MANIVRAIAADTRVGRLLFSSQLSNPVVVRKRAVSGALMAMLLFQHAGTLGAQNNDFIKATSHFAMGGVGQTITAWLAGDITLDNDQLVDRLAAIIDQLAVPELYKGSAVPAGTGGRRSAAVFGAVWVSLSVNSLVQQANSSVIPSGSWK